MSSLTAQEAEVSEMPLIEVTIGSLPRAQKRELAGLLTDVFATPEVPADWVTIVFRHINRSDYAKGGHFVYDSERSEGEGDALAHQGLPHGPGIVNITIGPLDEGETRRIAAGVSRALSAIGVAESHIQILFRHVSGRDVAEGGGIFPFRPPGSTW